MYNASLIFIVFFFSFQHILVYFRSRIGNEGDAKSYLCAIFFFYVGVGKFESLLRTTCSQWLVSMSASVIVDEHPMQVCYQLVGDQLH